MAPRVDPIASDEALPPRAEIVIIGGGIIGTSTALFLAQQGVSTVLVEKGHVAGEQSSRNWGWCRKMVRDPREIAAGYREPAAVAGDEPDGRGRDRVPHLRDHVSRREPGGSDAARSLARLRARVPARHPGRRRRRGGPAAARFGRSPGPARSIPRATARPSRRWRRRRSPRRRGAAVRRSSPSARRAASKPQAGGSRRWSPKRAASPAGRRCWPAARGRGSSAAISASNCRSSRCWVR